MLEQAAFAENTARYQHQAINMVKNDRTAGAMPVWNKSQGTSFGDILDMINPMHHIPVINKTYSKVTGDTIKPFAKIAGSTLYGGPLGAASSIANIILENETGKDMGAHAISLAFQDKKPAPTKLTENSPETALQNAYDLAKNNNDMAKTLLAFSDLSASQNAMTVTALSASNSEDLLKAPEQDIHVKKKRITPRYND